MCVEEEREGEDEIMFLLLVEGEKEFPKIRGHFRSREGMGMMKVHPRQLPCTQKPFIMRTIR